MSPGELLAEGQEPAPGWAMGCGPPAACSLPRARALVGFGMALCAPMPGDLLAFPSSFVCQTRGTLSLLRAAFREYEADLWL